MPLSYSQLRLYQVCPRQYEFANIKKLPRLVSPAESFGSSVHNTFKKWGDIEVESEKLKVENDQMEIFEGNRNDTSNFPLSTVSLTELWHQTFSPNAFKTRVEADFARQRGEQTMDHFFEWWSQKPRTVLAVEKGFSIAFDGLTLTGRFDRVEKDEDGIHVIDFKTSPPREQNEIDADLQLSIYAIAVEQEFKQPCIRLSFLFVNEEKCEQRSTERSENQLTDARKQILSMHKMIDERDFHPLPALEKCKRCPYRNVCDAAAA